MDAGILPLKDPANAKRRLGERFGDEIRISIAQALIDDAISLARSCGFLSWWVVSDSPDIRARAVEIGLRAVADLGTDLNEALRIALDAAAQAGAGTATIVPGDLPLAAPDDLRDILDTGETSDVVIVPSGGDGGTNGLFLRPVDAIEPLFGERSLRAHMDAAENAGFRFTVLPLERLAHDLDTSDDIGALVEADLIRPSRTVELLRSL